VNYTLINVYEAYLSELTNSITKGLTTESLASLGRGWGQKQSGHVSFYTMKKWLKSY